MQDKTNIKNRRDSIPKLILDNLPIGVIFCDTDLNIQFINRIYADYLKVDPDAALGKPITEYIPESRLSTVLETGKSEMGDKCHIGRLGDERVLIVNRIPVKGDDGLVGVISQSLFGDVGELRDLTERIDQLEKKVTSYKEKIKSALSAKYTIDCIKGQSQAIVKARELLTRYAITDSPVLLLGATGTGKELFAHALHTESKSKHGPFVSINCAAIPQDLLESELFGYAPGAFTGASREGKMGKIELANKGTLFLDEIGDMSLNAQVKLLRVLEDKILYRLGCIHSKKVEFRLIAATNRDLKAMMKDGRFREELYYRLNTMIIAIPLLKERAEDIYLLARHFLDSSNRHSISLSNKALRALMSYSWPGNIRELKNVIERAMSLCNGEIIDINDLADEVVPNTMNASYPENLTTRSTLSDSLANSELNLIQTALAENNWNIVKTSRLLGISRATMYEKIKRYSLIRPDISSGLPHNRIGTHRS